MTLYPGFWDLDCIGDANHRLWLARDIPLQPAFVKIPKALYLMLNPSKARGVGVGDPTQRKCDGFAARLGIGRYGVMNLFSRSTPYPEDLFMFDLDEAIGPANDRFLAEAFTLARLEKTPIICAWGKPSKFNRRETVLFENRVVEVMELVASHGNPNDLYCLADAGYPRHPLMLSYEDGSTLKHWTIV